VGCASCWEGCGASVATMGVSGAAGASGGVSGGVCGPRRSQDPGLSMSELGRRTGISKGALLHHLNIMKDLGLIHERRLGHSIRLFIQDVPVSSQISLATLQNQTARNLCSLIANARESCSTRSWRHSQASPAARSSSTSATW
jgi:DNA-binding transcriptional ArsR family regulator